MTSSEFSRAANKQGRNMPGKLVVICGACQQSMKSFLITADVWGGGLGALHILLRNELPHGQGLQYWLIKNEDLRDGWAVEWGKEGGIRDGKEEARLRLNLVSYDNRRSLSINIQTPLRLCQMFLTPVDFWVIIYLLTFVK